MAFTNNFNPVSTELLEQLTAIVGPANLSTAQADLDQHSKDQSHFEARTAEAVLWPTSSQQVADILKLANENHIPVTPWGVGTSLEGNPIPICGGLSVSFAKMDQIVQVHADDFQVTVQPGIGYKDLNEQLARYGLFFPPDPGANATIGGMLANNAAGIRTVKYGASKDNVLRMQIAVADGRLIQVGSRSVKQSSGYDLLHLFIGSEGTLGVITEATLKLAPVAEHMSAVLAVFETVPEAVEAVVAVRGSGLEPAALEFLDAYTAQMLGEAGGIEMDALPTLFMEFHAAHEGALQMGLDSVREICEELGAVKVQATADNSERRKLWHLRHHSFEFMVQRNPNTRFFINDVAVPISRYPEIIAYITSHRADLGLEAYMLGHAGDGNIHVVLPFKDDPGYKRASAFNGDIIRKAIELGGTATGEHGVGMGKSVYLQEEHGPAVDVMRAIKHTLDPNGILNPGKVLPQ